MDKFDYNGYYNYLSKRSRLGLYYRRFYLYPCLSRFLYGRVLDIGCGRGDFLGFYKQSVGVDVNPYNVEHCNSQGLDAYLVEDGCYPFENGSFDGVIIDNVLEHLIDPAPTLIEIQRVLKPGGMLIVGVPGRKGYDSAPDHKCFYSEEALVNVLHGFHFRVKKVLHMPLKSTWLERNVRQYCIYGIFEGIKAS